MVLEGFRVTDVDWLKTTVRQTDGTTERRDRHGQSYGVEHWSGPGTCSLNSPGNYFFWNEHLNSASHLERVGGCPHNLSSS